MSLAWLGRRLERFGGRQAVWDGDTILTYDDLHRAVRDTRERLRTWGVQPGDTIAFDASYSTANVTRFLAAL